LNGWREWSLQLLLRQAIYRCMVRIVWATIGRYTPTGSPDITDSRYSNLVVLEWLGKIADGRAR